MKSVCRLDRQEPLTFTAMQQWRRREFGVVAQFKKPGLPVVLVQSGPASASVAMRGK